MHVKISRVLTERTEIECIIFKQIEWKCWIREKNIESQRRKELGEGASWRGENHRKKMKTKNTIIVEMNFKNQ